MAKPAITFTLKIQLAGKAAQLARELDTPAKVNHGFNDATKTVKDEGSSLDCDGNLQVELLPC